MKLKILPINHHSLLFRLGVAMVTLISLALIGMFSSVFIAETSEGYAAAINQTGTLRMQSYRIANSIGRSTDETLIRSRIRTRILVDEFKQRLFSPRIHNILDYKSDNEILHAYQTVEDHWRENISKTLELYLYLTETTERRESEKDEIEKLAQLYLDQVDHFVDDIHLLVKSIEDEAEEKIQILRAIHLLAITLTFIVVIITMVMVQRHLLYPLRELLNCAQAVRKGHFELRSQYKESNELGELALAFNSMSEDLSVIYQDLEKRVKEKTADLERSNQSLELLYKTTQQLGTGSFTSEILYELIKSIEKQVGIHSGAICLGQAGDEQAFLFATTRSDELNKASVDCGKCFGKGRSHSFAFISMNNRRLQTFSTPIKDKDNQYGVLLVDYFEDEGLDDYQKRLIETVASHIVLTINVAQKTAQGRRIALLEERSVIARELHDSLAQSLTYLKIQMARLEQYMPKGESNQKSVEIIADIRDGLNGAYRQLRELLTTFRLKISEDGLTKTLENTVEEFRTRGELEIIFENNIGNCQFTPNDEIHIVQFVREALSNVVKHAQATHAILSIRCDFQGEVVIRVEDDGVGIGEGVSALHHFGIAIMTERANGLGGELIVGESADGGTMFELNFNISQSLQNDTSETDE